MVEQQIGGRGLHNARLLEAFEAVPRHNFVRPEDTAIAYMDGALPIGHGQTISQPYIVALMTDLLHLAGSEKVLEVGTGSGYQAAILSRLATEVHTIEFQPLLAEQARAVLAEYGNVHCHEGDGSLGLRDLAPFDAILVAAAAPAVPQPLLDQLVDPGRLVLPVGPPGRQVLQVWTLQGKKFKTASSAAVAFVLLRGTHGW